MALIHLALCSVSQVLGFACVGLGNIDPYWPEFDPQTVAKAGVVISSTADSVMPEGNHWIIASGRKRLIAKRIQEFRGFVRIGSGSSALGYVRLGDDDISLPNLRPRYRVELRRVAKLEPVPAVYGGDGASAHEGELATLSEQAWAALHLPEPTAKRTGHSWLVTRAVLLERHPGRAEGSYPAILTERVGFDGSYRLVKTKAIHYSPGKFKWTIARIAYPIPGA